MRNIKSNFEAVVRENSGWLLRYVRSQVKNLTVAEDLVQEILLNAYRAYDGYYDDGRLKNWLMRIARNRLNSYFSRESRLQLVSLDISSSQDEDSLYTYLSDGQTPEEKYLQKELVGSVMEVISRLPEKQRQIITYRFIEERNISEIAGIMNIPEGSVKSTTHYAINKIREQLGVQINNKRKGDIIMECKDIYKYLFIYANGTIGEENKKLVEEHIKGCEKCAGVVSALKKLLPTLVFAQEDEMTHFNIDFPSLDICYSCMGSKLDEYEELKKVIAETDGYIAKNGYDWVLCGMGNSVKLLAEFDNEGNEIEFEVIKGDEWHNFVKATYVKKAYPYMWKYSVYTGTPGVKRSKEAPNLYYGETNNTFGRAAKSALYHAIPAEATNIRIKRGNGVIDCGSYKFAYVDRYVAENENIALNYSFNLSE